MATNLNYKNIRKQEGDWMVIVNPKIGSFEMEIFLLNKRDGKDSIAHINKNGLLEVEPLKEGELNPAPFMQVSSDIWQLLVDAITESTPPTKKEVVEAQLESVKYHLEDMRKLVFDDKQINIGIDSNYLSCGHGSCLPDKCNYKKGENNE